MGKLAINGGKKVIEEDNFWVKWPKIEDIDKKSVLKVLEKGNLCRLYKGSWSEIFEKKWAKFTDTKYCIATSNGTVSLQLALRTLGVKTGDKVITTPVTFIATASSISELGAIPVFVDIDFNTGQISSEAIEENIDENTKGVIGVHYGGYPFDIDKVRKICKKHKLFLIEDAAHSHGTKWKGKHVGGFGDFGSFSFQESKSLQSGEGGAVITNSKKLYQQALLIHNIGRIIGKPGYYHYILSSNYRLPELCAGLLLSQLTKLKKQTKIKEKNADWLKENLKQLGIEPLPYDKRITQRGYYFIVFKFNKEFFGGISRDIFLKAINAEGIPFGKGYGYPLYKNPAFTKKSLSKIYPENILKILPNYENLYLENSEKFCEIQLTLSHRVLLSEKEKLQKIIEAVAKISENIDELVISYKKI
ncbi:MAG: DegT/DnrJ/EryC1/StrS family aminotransferase [Candidatus Omnitrophica bacterium]|nr:DegT/DnrJ/EryC1/StrS family aminotransferase [Candidatus Omnitrophota bacterium]